MNDQIQRLLKLGAYEKAVRLMTAQRLINNFKARILLDLFDDVD
mgnify:CR=1 FL=1